MCNGKKIRRPHTPWQRLDLWFSAAPVSQRILFRFLLDIMVIAKQSQTMDGIHTVGAGITERHWATNMTELYAISLSSLFDGHWKALLPQLDPERSARALSCRRDADAARIVGAGLLLQQALLRHGIPVSEQMTERDSFGKPHLVNRADLHFSLSHCDDLAVCAISNHPVGVDAELPRCSASLAQRHFHPEEAAFSHDPDKLCRIWTAKEAFLKALGLGLTVPLNSFLVRILPDQLQLDQTYSPLPYRLHEYTADTARICLCCLDEKPEPIVL